MFEAHATIASFLRVRREAAGLTRAELAGRAGVSEALIQKIEQGIRQPTSTALAALFTALEVESPYRERAASALLPELTGLHYGELEQAELNFLRTLPYPAWYQTVPEHDIVAVNDAHRRWFPGVEPGVNALAWMLLDPRARAVIGDWEREVRTMVYAFRHMGPGAAASARGEEIAAVCRQSPDWERLWSAGLPPEGVPHRRTRVRSPDTGELTVMNVQLFRCELPRREWLMYTMTPARSAE
ncbi:MAG: helix-turn-helix transcriptional regulator [Nocardia sp.]|uniref:helix-turn-helix domain-containing protein n=1 Tax=Nocardia sp. TaxID=1821 RepID=UPI002622A503|nr:helix-turn-helix domain-containing protein [Nocardia sp.]MCU1640043.1 helix-turn-helix transcriptional regulator [Nocardia sp.]